MCDGWWFRRRRRRSPPSLPPGGRADGRLSHSCRRSLFLLLPAVVCGVSFRCPARRQAPPLLFQHAATSCPIPPTFLLSLLSSLRRWCPLWLRPRRRPMSPPLSLAPLRAVLFELRMCKLGRFRPVASVSRPSHPPCVRGGRLGVPSCACTARNVCIPARVLVAVPHPHSFVPLLSGFRSVR